MTDFDDDNIFVPTDQEDFEQQQQNDDDGGDLDMQQQQQQATNDDNTTSTSVSVAAAPSNNNYQIFGNALARQNFLALCKWQDLSKHAVWTLSSAKQGNGVEQIRDNMVETFWQYGKK